MDSTAQPMVSVLTPVYNGAAYLAECIESVLRQTYKHFEYIIVNNCSTDATLEIAKKYATKDSRIRVHTNGKFVGVIDNHNIAFRMMSASAKYCKIVSADDLIFPSCIEQMVALAEANPAVGIIGSYQLSGDVVRWQGLTYPNSVVPGREMGRWCFLGPQMFWGGKSLVGFGSPTSLMYRADLVKATPSFYPNQSPHSDTSACFGALQSSDFGFVYEVLAYERTHSETQTSASQQLNRYAPQTLSDLLEYGPFYLSHTELEEQIRLTLKFYHRFLAVSYLVGHKSTEFWDYHKGRLRELGYPLRSASLVKAAVLTILEEAANPGLAVEKLRKQLARRKQRKAGAGKRAGTAVNTTLAKC